MPRRPCPECGTDRMGNRRGSCRQCNRFAARARTVLIRIFRSQHPTIYAQAAAEAERTVYDGLRSTVPEEATGE